MGRPRRTEQTSPHWHANPARAPCDIDPKTGAPDPPYVIGERDLRLRGADLERVQADVERWKRYGDLDAEGDDDGQA